MNKDIEKYLNIKKPYDPVALLNTWMNTAQTHSTIQSANAVVLSTLNSNQKISSRTVLIKEITKDSLIFYTNQTSLKGRQLKQNNQCTLHFYWDPLFRQASIQGKARPISKEKTTAYWETRPIESQLSQWVSKQSSPVKDRETLEQEVQTARLQFKNKQIPCPKHWVGYSVKAEQIEFWLGRDHRLHDRFLFIKKKDQWTAQRLYP